MNQNQRSSDICFTNSSWNSKLGTSPVIPFYLQQRFTLCWFNSGDSVLGQPSIRIPIIATGSLPKLHVSSSISNALRIVLANLSLVSWRTMCSTYQAGLCMFIVLLRFQSVDLKLKPWYVVCHHGCDPPWASSICNFLNTLADCLLVWLWWLCQQQ